MLRKRITALVFAVLAVPALLLGLSLAGAVAASASPPPPANHCPLWANYVLHHPYPHCYANL